MMEVKGKHSNFTEKCERQKDQLLIAKEENLKHGVWIRLEESTWR